MKPKTDNSPRGTWPERLLMRLLKAIARMPFFLIYGLADVLAVVLMYVIRYRRKVVHQNLRLSFPEKTDRQIGEITRRFYHHFADTILETVKGYRMTEKDFSQRMVFHGIEKVNEHYYQEKSIILLGMHYNNWEWCFYSQKFVRHQALIVYNPLRNSPLLEEFLVKMRERWGGRSLPVNHSAVTVMRFHKDKVPFLVLLGADQRPPEITSHWTRFLNQEACFHGGPFKIAHYTNQPVFFIVIQKVKRGHYEAHFMPLVSDPSAMAGEDILQVYVETMERYIREKPEFYLWTHKRWKQKRPDQGALSPSEPNQVNRF